MKESLHKKKVSANNIRNVIYKEATKQSMADKFKINDNLFMNTFRHGKKSENIFNFKTTKNSPQKIIFYKNASTERKYQFNTSNKKNIDNNFTRHLKLTNYSKQSGNNNIKSIVSSVENSDYSSSVMHRTVKPKFTNLKMNLNKNNITSVDFGSMYKSGVNFHVNKLNLNSNKNMTVKNENEEYQTLEPMLYNKMHFLNKFKSYKESKTVNISKNNSLDKNIKPVLKNTTSTLYYMKNSNICPEIKTKSNCTNKSVKVSRIDYFLELSKQSQQKETLIKAKNSQNSTNSTSMRLKHKEEANKQINTEVETIKLMVEDSPKPSQIKQMNIQNYTHNNESKEIKQNSLNPNQLDELNISNFSVFKDANYYKNEAIQQSEYIKKYFCNKAKYPPTELNFYKYGKLLGRGAYGKVNLGLHIGTGRMVAIKSFNKEKKSDKAINKILNEITIMKVLNNSNVIKLYETFNTSQYILIVIEYVSGGDLLSFVKRRTKLDEITTKYIFKQVIMAIQYVHSLNILHRDVKLDNILIDLKGNIKLCDFGVSRIIKKGELILDQCGTPAYIAPEILTRQGYEGFKSDVWSAGVVLYAMLAGTVPFKAEKVDDLYNKIRSGNFTPIKGVSKDAANLVSSLLDINPSKRISLEEVLEHPFLDSTPDNMELFTDAEKYLLAKNDVDYRSSNKEDLTQNFTIKNLYTLNEALNKNIQTRSIILAPFNTSYKSELTVNFEVLPTENFLIKYSGNKLKELNKNYEFNNNGDLDNGVIISPKKISEVNSPRETLVRQLNQKSSNKQIHNFIKKSNSTQFNLDTQTLEGLKSIGYSKDYVFNCLQNNEKNYATTAYYLLSKV